MTNLNLKTDLLGIGSRFDRLQSHIDPIISGILDKALDGKDISVEDAAKLFEAKGLTLNLLVIVADELRKRTVGDVVTYIVNRNINFTNLCIKRCGFCAFSRGNLDEEAYSLSIDEVVKRAKEASTIGATEVCIQAGLPPRMDPYLYVKICKAIKKELPNIHIHAFSPEEVVYAANCAGSSVEDYLKTLKEAGVDSLPGTSAEILDDEVRRYISPGRITTKEWINVIKSAHRLDIPTTSTIMYGHVENSLQKAKHIDLIKQIQMETHGFTEFVPLSFVHSETPMYKTGCLGNRRIEGLRKGPTGAEVLKTYAVARLMLNNHVKNLQVSWVKEGPKLSQICLNAGCNDFGGTLMNESISSAAGAQYGQYMDPKEFRNLIRDIGRIPAERSTTYRILKVFNQNDNCMSSK